MSTSIWSMRRCSSRTDVHAFAIFDAYAFAFIKLNCDHILKFFGPASASNWHSTDLAKRTVRERHSLQRFQLWKLLFGVLLLR
jgi:hypothetical protein